MAPQLNHYRSANGLQRGNVVIPIGPATQCRELKELLGRLPHGPLDVNVDRSPIAIMHRKQTPLLSFCLGN